MMKLSMYSYQKLSKTSYARKTKYTTVYIVRYILGWPKGSFGFMNLLANPIYTFYIRMAREHVFAFICKCIKTVIRMVTTGPHMVGRDR